MNLSARNNSGNTLETASATKLAFAEFYKIAQTKSRQIDNGVRATIDDIQATISKAYVEHGARGIDNK